LKYVLLVLAGLDVDPGLFYGLKKNIVFYLDNKTILFYICE